jgi:serine kinase of HPr protein (carbohydrate metabolism regulator)
VEAALGNSPAGLFHGTCVALDSGAAILLGKPSAGKSDLALRFIHSAFPAAFGKPTLVADDQVVIARSGERLIASPPLALAGRIEVRGLGILDMPYLAEAELLLAIELSPAPAVPRLPDLEETRDFAGIGVPRLRLEPFAASAPLKLALALRIFMARNAETGESECPWIPNADKPLAWG